MKDKKHSCPSCGSNMVLRKGPSSDFWGCLAYPACRTSMDLNGKVSVKNVALRVTKEKEETFEAKCPECDAQMSKRSGRRGEFYGCNNFWKTSCKGTRKVEEVEIYGTGVEQEVDLKELFKDIKKDQIKRKAEEVKAEKPKKEIALIPTSKFPHLKFKFEQFNPVQSEVFEYYDKDVNCVVAAATSAGKTTIAEMFMADTISKGKKAIFLSPLKAVSQEKYEDWTDVSHDWSKLNISIVTGDYALTDARVEELNKANIIIMTTEMLDSRTRRIAIEKNNWLLETGVVVCDEAHLLTTSRGDKLESAMMRFTRQNPICRIVFLSATMVNVNEICRWLSTLNNKKSELINSEYRPIQLDIHYESYDDYGKYATVEQNKMQKVIELCLKKYSLKEQVLIFVHAKKTGHNLYDMFLNKGIKSNEIDFHYGDLDLKTRLNVEKRTKNGEIKILIATSTLAWGINI